MAAKLEKNVNLWKTIGIFIWKFVFIFFCSSFCERKVSQFLSLKASLLFFNARRKTKIGWKIYDQLFSSPTFACSGDSRWNIYALQLNHVQIPLIKCIIRLESRCLHAVVFVFYATHEQQFQFHSRLISQIMCYHETW